IYLANRAWRLAVLGGARLLFWLLLTLGWVLGADRWPALGSAGLGLLARVPPLSTFLDAQAVRDLPAWVDLVAGGLVFAATYLLLYRLGEQWGWETWDRHAREDARRQLPRAAVHRHYVPRAGVWVWLALLIGGFLGTALPLSPWVALAVAAGPPLAAGTLCSAYSGGRWLVSY